MSDVANKLLRKFSVSLAVLAGPGLANSFEEAFVWHLAWKKNLVEAYIAAGFLGSGDVAEKANELLRKPEIAARSIVVAKACRRLSANFPLFFNIGTYCRLRVSMRYQWHRAHGFLSGNCLEAAGARIAVPNDFLALS